MASPSFRAAICAGQRIRCKVEEGGVLEGVDYWAFSDEEVEESVFEIFCAKADAPADLQPDEVVNGVVREIQIGCDDRPAIFLSRVSR